MENGFIANAQKGVKDPKSQNLRSRKKQWNALVSGVIHILIGAKQGVNGRGNAELGLPPSNIKDPLPKEVVGILSDLATEFQKIIQEAKGIVEEQENYSQTRRQPQSKGQPGVPSPLPLAATINPSLVSLAYNLKRKHLLNG